MYETNLRKMKLGRVAQWLATCNGKPKAPGLSPAAAYFGHFLRSLFPSDTVKNLKIIIYE